MAPSKASFDSKNIILKECYVSLERNFLLKSSKPNSEDTESSANKSNRSEAKKYVSKKLQKKKRSEEDLESSENECDSYKVKESVSKCKELERLEKDIESSEDESDTNVAPKKVSKTQKTSEENNDSNENMLNKRKTSKETEKNVESSENESSENEDSESISLSITNKHKLLKLNKTKLDEANRENIACKICKKDFNTYSSFVLHQRQHKIKQFRCTICKETFKFRASFINHHKREHPERECYPCEFPGCNASFRTMKESRNHEKYHCKYMCRFCKKRYARKKMMLWHVREVHPSKI